MGDLHELAKPAIHTLFVSDENQLFEELAIRSKAIAKDPALAGSFNLAAPYDARVMGPMDDVRRFGKIFFDRVNRQCYDLVCGRGVNDTKERQNVMDAFKLGKEDLAAAIAAMLVAQLAMAPAVAAVVSVLVVKLFFRPAVDAMCQVWSERTKES